MERALARAASGAGIVQWHSDFQQTHTGQVFFSLTAILIDGYPGAAYIDLSTYVLGPQAAGSDDERIIWVRAWSEAGRQVWERK